MMSQASDDQQNQPTATLTHTPNGLGRLLADPTPVRKRPPPPLEKWNPPYCGEMDLRITAQGEWFHEGVRMTRQSLVDLFATVLWREEDRYFLKTPVEKIGIIVEDVPLLAIDVDQVEQDGMMYLQLTTKTGDVVLADADHPIQMREYLGEMRPYIRVRRNLEALIHRNVFYHLVNMGELVESEHGTSVRLQSGDQVFELGAIV